ncbi:hypothetical protein DPMN_088527 [Dreissena polymorpha]|uniref:Uncharacterized protein n=1 Tax=Dreissena polymorpha TaxID=45954 RepID=A0A9D4KV62_DREPO|nr:hypothetical protein DPMN_088527 [Dreissena polymorpha]
MEDMKGSLPNSEGPFNTIQLVTKFGEDRMKFRDRPTDGPTDRQSDSYIAPLPMVMGMGLKNALPTGGHVFQASGIIFELIQDIIGTNLLTKFHDDRTINVASRVLKRDYTICYIKNAPPPGGHVFLATDTIFKLIQDIIRTHLLTKFHEDRKINVASRPYKEKCPAPGGHIFQPTSIIFELVHDIIGINLLTKFHEDRTINVPSRVKNAPPLDSNVFQAKVTIFKLIQDIIETNLLTKFHEDWTINVASRVFTRKTARSPGGHVFSPIWTIFKLVQYINKTNVLTKFHDDWAKIVTSRVFTRNTAPPPGGYLHEDWASNVTSTFRTQSRYQWKNVLTKFHEDQTINVASRVFTRQNVDDARRTTDKRQSQKLTMNTLCSGALKMGVAPTYELSKLKTTNRYGRANFDSRVNTKYPTPDPSLFR